MFSTLESVGILDNSYCVYHHPQMKQLAFGKIAQELLAQGIELMFDSSLPSPRTYSLSAVFSTKVLTELLLQETVSILCVVLQILVHKLDLHEPR